MNAMASRQNGRTENYRDGEVLDANFHKVIGLVHEFLMAGQKAGLRRHELAKMAESPELMRQVRCLVDGFLSRRSQDYDTLKEARKILGETAVFSFMDASAMWGALSPGLEEGTGIDHNGLLLEDWRQILEVCAQENEKNDTRWRLVWSRGLPLRHIIEHSSSPYSLLSPRACTHLLADKEIYILPVSQEAQRPQYRLIDFKPRFAHSENVSEQIKTLGEGFSEAHPTTVIEATMTLERFGDNTAIRVLRPGWVMKGLYLWVENGDGYNGIPDSFRLQDNSWEHKQLGAIVERNLYKV